MSFSLPPLPYAFDALEPAIDARTMEIHHGKHHQAYVNNVNTALQGHDALQALSVEALIADLGRVPESIRAAVRNNGGGHANHSLFWTIMKPGGGGAPGGELGAAIDAAFGGLDAFKTQLSQAGMTRFGSGWAWLSLDGAGQLRVESTANQDSPLMEGRTPIMGVDVWEHAYYLKYQNLRNAYLEAWWSTLDWDAIAARYARARGG